MKYPIPESAIVTHLCYLRKWHDEALTAANAAEFDGDFTDMMKWDLTADSLAREIKELEGRIA